MERTQINPWSWQDEFGYSQGWRVDGPASILFIAGQVALAPDGSHRAYGADAGVAASARRDPATWSAAALHS